MEIAKYLLDNYADTLKFRLTRFATVNVLLVTKGLVDEKIMKVDNLTMSSRVNRSALWKDGVAGVGQKVSLSSPAKSSSTNHVLWEPAWDADFWKALLSSCGAQPLRKGDCIIELQFGVNLVEAVGKEIRELQTGDGPGALCALWLGFLTCASPAKCSYMSSYLEKMLSSCIAVHNCILHAHGSAKCIDICPRSSSS